MALIKCPDCDNECSTLAQSCPKCGRPLQSASSQSAEAALPMDANESNSESEKEKSASERRKRIASIPVTSSVLTSPKPSTVPLIVQSERSATIGCLIAAAIFIALAFFCCSSGRNSSPPDSTYTPSGGGSTVAPSSGGSAASPSESEITRRRYEECVRQRSAAGLDTSPCAEWSKER